MKIAKGKFLNKIALIVFYYIKFDNIIMVILFMGISQCKLKQLKTI